MKKLGFTTLLLVFFVFLFNGIQGQTTKTQLDQVKLIKQFTGTFQANHGKDTVEVWTGRLYGSQAFVIDVSLMVKGKKLPNYINNISYDPKEGKFKGFTLWPNGDYGTWIGSYTTETKFDGVFTQDFGTQPGGKIEIVYKNVNDFTFVTYNNDGVKTQDLHFIRAK